MKFKNDESAEQIDHFQHWKTFVQETLGSSSNRKHSKKPQGNNKGGVDDGD